MSPDDLEDELARDPWLRALSELPRGDVDEWRSARLRARAHAELARATQAGWLATFGRSVEPVLLAACTGLGVWRLAWVLITLVR
ncbi:MAG: hypothetical protein ABW321_18205 [Polyangiales bacterium]